MESGDLLTRQGVHLDVVYPDARQLNRFLPLVKWLLAIPHYVVLLFLSIASFVAVVLLTTQPALHGGHNLDVVGVRKHVHGLRFQ